jgi:beta-galactosidase
VLLNVLELAGLTGPDQSLPTTVRVKHGLNRKGKALHYYLNYSSDPQTVTYAYGPGADLLTQSAVARAQSITLKPWDAEIIEEK